MTRNDVLFHAVVCDDPFGLCCVFIFKEGIQRRWDYGLNLQYPFLCRGFLYLASALLNIYVLRYLDYSVVLPLTSFTYIWTMVFSYFILKEKITGKKIIGVALILAGAAAVSM